MEKKTETKLTKQQLFWLQCGLNQAGGKLPLFDNEGRKISVRTIQSCIKNGWAEPWFNNPMKPDWLVCRITDLGLNIVKQEKI